MDEADRALETLISILKAKGPRDLDVVKLTLDLCRRQGRTDQAAEAVSRFLIDTGLSKSIIPAPVPRELLSGELLERVQVAIFGMVEQYHRDGGVLTARRIVDPGCICSRMERYWRSLSPPKIAGTEDLPNYEKQHERIQRTAVAAQACLNQLQAFSKVLSTRDVDSQEAPWTDGLFIPEDRLEEFCLSAAKAMEQAYRAPDEWVAEKLGGVREGLRGTTVG